MRSSESCQRGPPATYSALQPDDQISGYIWSKALLLDAQISPYVAILLMRLRSLRGTNTLGRDWVDDDTNARQFGEHSLNLIGSFTSIVASEHVESSAEPQAWNDDVTANSAYRFV
jgi:hypothetical protein